MEDFKIKNKNILISMIIIFCIIIINNTVASAATTSHNDQYSTYYIKYDNDNLLDNATIISSESYSENNRKITTTVYKNIDGTLITDTLNIPVKVTSIVAPLSLKGTDTATRTRTISNWGSITIKASFKWYTKGFFSYVKCTGMSVSRSLKPNVRVNKWERSYTSDYVKISKATDKVTYYFYNSKIPVQHQNGTFKITCSDSGTISDND